MIWNSEVIWNTITNYPCSVSEKQVLETDKGVGCDHCNWFIIKMNQVNLTLNIYKISGIASNVYLKFFHFTQTKQMSVLFGKCIRCQNKIIKKESAFAM